MKAQIALQVKVQSCGQSVHLHDPRLRTEPFSFSDFFKEPPLSGGPLLFGAPLHSGLNWKGKIYVTIGGGGGKRVVTFGILRFTVKMDGSPVPELPFLPAPHRGPA